VVSYAAMIRRSVVVVLHRWWWCSIGGGGAPSVVVVSSTPHGSDGKGDRKQRMEYRQGETKGSFARGCVRNAEKV